MRKYALDLPLTRPVYEIRALQLRQTIQHCGIGIWFARVPCINSGRKRDRGTVRTTPLMLEQGVVGDNAIARSRKESHRVKYEFR
jgi:hypothetical protein